MRVKREPKPIQKTCIDCGEIFIAYGHKAQRCPECKKLRMKQYHKKHLMENPNETKKPKAKKTHQIKPKLTMREVLRKLEIYNKANGTHLTYGQFIVLLEKGA